jgi:hypothetical protein
MSDDTYETNESEQVREKASQEDLMKMLLAQQQRQDKMLQWFVKELQETRGNALQLQQVTRVTEALATQLRQGAATTLTDAAKDEIRKYSILRSRLGGQQNTGAMTQARIRAIFPPKARIGDLIEILLENAGVPATVAFTGPDGGVVLTNQIIPVRKGRLPNHVIAVEVPAGAMTGPVTVVTDQGEPTSTTRDFFVESD